MMREEKQIIDCMLSSQIQVVVFVGDMTWHLRLSEDNLVELYAWIDQIPLSKPKRRIERDFSDGTLVAEIVRHYLAGMVDMHNYIPSNSFRQKKINWEILNRKIFGHFGLSLSETILNDLCNAKAGPIEIVLFHLRSKINKELEWRHKIPQQDTFTSRQALLSMNTISSTDDSTSFLSTQTSGTSRSMKSVSRLDYEVLKQQCLEQQEEIQILKIKMHRLEHVAQLKDVRIGELTATIKDCPHIKPTNVVLSKHKKK